MRHPKTVTSCLQPEPSVRPKPHVGGVLGSIVQNILYGNRGAKKNRGNPFVTRCSLFQPWCRCKLLHTTFPKLYIEILSVSYWLRCCKTKLIWMEAQLHRLGAKP